jgi:radical SAM family protein
VFFIFPIIYSQFKCFDQTKSGDKLYPVSIYTLTIIRKNIIMKTALVTCPYFTNGDWPPLGLSCVNGALLEAGEETVCFDFGFQTYQEDKDTIYLLKNLVNLGRLEDEVLFILNPYLVLYFLFKDVYPDFSWKIPFDGQEKAAAAMLFLGMQADVKKQSSMVLTHAPKAVMFSTYLSNILWSLMLAKELKNNSGVPVFFGGPGSALPETRDFVTSLGFVDGVIVGEGEVTVVEIIKDLEKSLNSPPPGLFVNLDGKKLFAPRKPGPLHNLPKASFKGLPLPEMTVTDYKINRPNDYQTPFFYGLPVYSSRGCVNHCSYCSETAYWNGYRLRPPKSVCDEIESLMKNTGERHFLFGDSAVNGKPDWLNEFCEIAVKKDMNAIFCSYMMARPELDEKAGRLIYDAGFRHVVLGIETFSLKMRTRMNKKHGGDELFSSILSLTRAGVNVKSNLLVGFPGESKEDFQESIHFIEKWRNMSEAEKGPGLLYWDAGHPVRVEAYSDLYNNPGDFGIKITDDHLPPLPDGLMKLADKIGPVFKIWQSSFKNATKERSKLMKDEVEKKR